MSKTNRMSGNAFFSTTGMLFTAFLVSTALVAGPAMAQESLSSDAELPFVMNDETRQAPFGQDMPAVVINYSRAAPTVGAGGMISEGAMEVFKGHGFRTVVSLLTDPEGPELHAQWARDADIAYHNLQVNREGPGDPVLEQFVEIMADSANYPVMVHCASASRVGALWARYRIQMGVATEVAFQEARTIGLQPSLEQTVRENFGY